MPESALKGSEVSPQTKKMKPGNSSLKRVTELLLLFLALSASVVYFNLMETESLYQKSLRDSSHAWVFFLGTCTLIQLLRISPIAKSRASGSLLALAFTSALLTGISIEILQPLVGRSASFLDIWYDLLGTSAAVVLHLASKTGTTWAKRAWLGLGVLGLLLISAIQPLYYLKFERLRAELFPVLFNFEHDWEREMFNTNQGAHHSVVDAPSEWQGNAGKVLRLDINSGSYPGLRLQHFEADWRQYRTLAIDIFVKKALPQPLNLRINDASHNQKYADRLNKKLNLHPGMNKVFIDLNQLLSAPAGREMDLSRMQKIILFSQQPGRPFSLYIDNIRLH